MRKSWPGRRRYTDGLKKLPNKASDTRLAELWGESVANLLRWETEVHTVGVLLLVPPTAEVIEAHTWKAALHGRRAIRQGRIA